MSNKKDIQSILLANFLGWEVSTSARKFKADINDLPYGYNKLRLKDLKFQQSYDWLMLVVDKIDELGYNTIIESYDTGTHVNRSITICSELNEKFDDLQYEGDNKFKLLLKACIDFVNWFNENGASTSGQIKE